MRNWRSECDQHRAFNDDLNKPEYQVNCTSAVGGPRVTDLSALAWVPVLAYARPTVLTSLFQKDKNHKPSNNQNLKDRNIKLMQIYFEQCPRGYLYDRSIWKIWPPYSAHPSHHPIPPSLFELFLFYSYDYMIFLLDLILISWSSFARLCW